MMDFVDLAAISIHDVKNRLAVLAGRAEARGDAESARGALEAALTLTRLLTVFKSEKGRIGVGIDAFAPVDLIRELAAEGQKLSSFVIYADADSAPTLGFYDEALVRLVLRDALFNAMRYATSAIRLAARMDGSFLEFSVTDDGPGYPSHLLGRPVAMQAVSEEGTGLGLYLAARVARLHENAGREGSIELRNERGAVFVLRLPQ